MCHTLSTYFLSCQLKHTLKNEIVYVLQDWLRELLCLSNHAVAYSKNTRVHICVFAFIAINMYSNSRT